MWLTAPQGGYIPGSMHLRLLPIVSLALFAAPAAGQLAWTEPVSAPWPLADIALHRTAAGLRLLAIPNSITAQSDSLDNYLDVELDSLVIAAWVPRARQFVDSVLRGPRDINARPAGPSLPLATGPGRVTLAHQPSARPTSRFLLLFSTAPGEGWSVQGDTEAARRFLPVDSTVRVLLTSGPEYTREARRYLPTVRYTPARCGDMPVPVLVQQGLAWQMERPR